MFNVIADLNWWAIAAAFVVMVALAAVWFPLVIAKPYAVALGRVGVPAPASTALTAFGPIVCILVTLLTSAVLVEALDITSVADAVVFGLIVGVGYLSAMTFQIAVNPNFPRPLLYGIINAPYFVLSSVTACVILVAMR